MTVIGQRGRYVDITNPSDMPGRLRKETTRWTVDGPHHLHEFRHIQIAQTTNLFILHSQIIEHWMSGQMTESFEWGHDVVKAYVSSQTWAADTAGNWTALLIAARIFQHDLPCCGGSFMTTKSMADYCTVTLGRCLGCKAKWMITDGSGFRRYD